MRSLSGDVRRGEEARRERGEGGRGRWKGGLCDGFAAEFATRRGAEKNGAGGERLRLDA